jgi:hypothetical protein
MKYSNLSILWVECNLLMVPILTTDIPLAMYSYPHAKESLDKIRQQEVSLLSHEKELE